MKRITLLLLIGLVTAAGALADQPLETSGIQQLIERLCQRSATGWIEQGQIEAIHQSFDILSGEATETHETVITDGNRFTWQIQIASHSDNVQSKGQDTKDFLEWNQDRTFIWDGESYTLYFRPGNHAIIYEEPSISVNVTGPLKAGYIPWGQGVFTFQSLSAAQASAVRVQTKDGLRIRFSVQPAEGLQMQFILDPARDDAVLSYTLERPGLSKVVQTYGNFTEWQGSFIPMNILIDRYDNNQLCSSDAWEITSLQDTLPQPDPFTPSFQEKALVERHSPMLDKPVFYRHSKGRNIESLLEKRFVAALKKANNQKQNCGIVAVEQIISEFGVSVADSELEPLVHDVSGDTTLYQIQQLAQQKGLHCLAVKTDVAGLGRYKGSQILLHFPEKKHFVLLDRIDRNSAWIIDLDRQTFYNHMELSQLKQEWAGIALIVSDEPLSLGKEDKPVPEPILKNIAGSADYSCSEPIQEYSVEECSDMVNDSSCGGQYTVREERYACEFDSGGGFCSGTGIIGSVFSPCIIDTDHPDQCKSSGDFTVRDIRACLP